MQVNYSKKLDKKVVIGGYILMKGLSYFLFAPFLLILGFDFIFIMTILQNKGVIDMKGIIDQISNIPYFGKKIYLWLEQYKHIDNNNDLTDFMGSILFFLGGIYAILDILVYILFKKHIKVNTIKMISIIIFLSYIFYIWLLLYLFHRAGYDIMVLLPFIIFFTIYMLRLYFSVILSIKLNYWADLLLDKYLGQNNNR